MREILFRGKGNKKYNDGSWQYGYLKKDSDGDSQICGSCWSRTVIPETVGQYTGLTDKNGEKIFEGDIIKNETERLFVVIYKFGGFDLAPISWLEDIDKTLTYNTLGDVQTALYTMSNAEIIGNIHDNPELLGVSK